MRWFAVLGNSPHFLSNVLTRDDIIDERLAWDVFSWYDGLVRMAAAFGETGITRKFAEAAATTTADWLRG